MALDKFQKQQFAYMGTNFALTPSGKRGVFHLACPSCREASGRSGVYMPSISRYYCWQPSCMYGKAVCPKGTWIVKLISDIVKHGNLSMTYTLLSKQNIKNINFKRAEQAYDVSDRKVVTLPVEAKPIIEGKGYFAKKARAYLEGRGYDIKRLWEKFSIHYIDTINTDDDRPNMFGYIIIPFFDIYGRLVYYQLRSYLPDLPRWRNPGSELFGIGKSKIMHNERVLLTQEGRLLLNEGATDTMAVEGAGILGLVLTDPVVFKLSKSIADMLLVMLDGGAYLEALLHAYRLIVTGTDVGVVPMTGTDDPSSLGKENALKLADSSTVLINHTSFIEELSRIEFIKGKSFRGTHKRILW